MTKQEVIDKWGIKICPLCKKDGEWWKVQPLGTTGNYYALRCTKPSCLYFKQAPMSIRAENPEDESKIARLGFSRAKYTQIK